MYVFCLHICLAFLDPLSYSWCHVGSGSSEQTATLLNFELSLQLQSSLLDYAQMHITIHLSLWSLELVDLAVLAGQKPPRIHCIPGSRIRVLHLVFYISSGHPDSGSHTSLSTF